MTHTPQELNAIAAELATEVGIDPFTWRIGICAVCPGKDTVTCAPWPEVLSYGTDPRLKEMDIPAPLTPACLFIFLHELGHVHFHHVNSSQRQEREASCWAREQMELRGVTVPLEVWNEAVKNFTTYEVSFLAGTLHRDLALHEAVVQQLRNRSAL